jgi:hypothetical protein
LSPNPGKPYAEYLRYGVSRRKGGVRLRFKNLECLACILIAAAFVIPAGVLGTPPSSKGGQEKQWDLLMYWDADNSLEFCTEFAMQTWEKSLTSNKDVNVIALVDILSMDGIWVYEISGGARKVVAQWPEMNTSDPAVLENFVLYAMLEYPAKKTMLVLQDHGYGWRGICQDETNGNVLMPIDGIGSALKDVKAQNGKGVDILAFDACNMATLEVAYELRGAVPYIVGSQSVVPFDGLPYEMMITDLIKTPGMLPADLAKIIVDDYVMYYSSKWDYDHIMTYSQDFATMAAIDTSKMATVGDAFQTFAKVLKPLINDHKKQIQDARGYSLVGTWTNMAGYEWMPDVYTFVEGLRAISGHPELTSAIDAFEHAFNAALFAQDNSKKYHDTVHGLNFWFPPSLSQYNMQGWTWARQFIYENSGLDLVDGNSPWVQCLMTYYGA